MVEAMERGQYWCSINLSNWVYRQKILLRLLKPGLELLQSPETVGDFVFLDFIHLGISSKVSTMQRAGRWIGLLDLRLPVILKDWIPACDHQLCKMHTPQNSSSHTEIRRTSCWYDLAL
jgi:hypothetical protein